MPYTITRIDTTPNPNALKCTLDRPICDGIRSFRQPEEAADDPLASAIFAIPGVTCLLMNGDWMTVNKEAGADWGSVKKGLERVLGEFGG